LVTFVANRGARRTDVGVFEKMPLLRHPNPFQTYTQLPLWPTVTAASAVWVSRRPMDFARHCAAEREMAGMRIELD
jgi:hypothetical protein